MSPIRLMSECANAEDHFTKSWNFAYNVALLYKILFSTVIEEKNERKAFEIGPNAHFYLDENVVWDLHFIIFFDIYSMFLVNSISCPVEDGTAAPGNPIHPILYNRPDNRCPGNSPHSCSSMSPISDLV